MIHTIYRSFMLLTISIAILGVMIACGPSEEDKKVAELFEKAKTSSSESIVENTTNYLQNLVNNQQKMQQANPKKMDVELIQTSLAFASELSKEYPETSHNTFFKINEATLNMFVASYYAENGDIVKATMAVSEGVDIFDNLVGRFPTDAFVRAYRAINYSHLPELFGKTDIVAEDFGLLLAYLAGTSTFDERENTFYPIALRRAQKFFTKQDHTENAAEATRLLDTLFSVGNN